MDEMGGELPDGSGLRPDSCAVKDSDTDAKTPTQYFKMSPFRNKWKGL
jgi:hypothetical protein